MGTTSAGAAGVTCPPPSRWGGGARYLLLLLLLLLLASRADTEKNKFYHMQSLCKNHFLQQLYRKIDGAVLRSQNERNLDCVITFQTHSILQRFMLRFDLLQLDCNDHLFIYDGAHAVGSYKADLSCRNTKTTVGAVYTRTNFVTLKYVTDAWGTENNGFKLTITAVKDKKHACKEFRCTLQEFCISPDLECDEVNHCGDNSDEAATCPPGHEMGTILGLGMPVFVVLTVGVILILCVSGAGLVICLCRCRRRGGGGASSSRRAQQQQSPANSAYPLTHQTHGSKNGTTAAAGGSYNTSLAGPAHQYSGVSATLPRLQTSAVAGTGASYYQQQQQSATLQRTTTAPSHPRDNTNGPRVSFLPSGNPPLPVASGRGYCSRGAQGNLTTYLAGSEDLDQTVTYRPTKRTNGSSRG